MPLSSSSVSHVFFERGGDCVVTERAWGLFVSF